jgi:hypothetical protein
MFMELKLETLSRLAAERMDRRGSFEYGWRHTEFIQLYPDFNICSVNAIRQK